MTGHVVVLSTGHLFTGDEKVGSSHDNARGIVVIRVPVEPGQFRSVVDALKDFVMGFGVDDPQQTD